MIQKDTAITMTYVSLILMDLQETKQIWIYDHNRSHDRKLAWIYHPIGSHIQIHGTIFRDPAQVWHLFMSKIRFHCTA